MGTAMQGSLHSFFLAGFECSAHTRADGIRLDLLNSTDHARLARQDYEQVRSYGMKSARDGVRWHLVEQQPNVYDWSSWLPMLQASQQSGMQVIWDLCHYSWPDHLDIWSAAFVDHFARYARAAAQLIRDETGMTPLLCPINEISFWAWAGGDVAYISPLRKRRGDRLKRQLVRATIAAIDAIRSVDPAARILLAEPLINVVGNPDIPGDVEAAELFRVSQFQAADMIAGRLAPELGGRPEYLDIVGANFYPHNQWYLKGNTIPLGHHSYRSLNEMLSELYQRYSLPVLISETGAEGGARPYWLHHVCAEVMQSIRNGVPIEGICLYPVLDYHGWDNDRICRAGLLSMPDARNHRVPYLPLLEELRRQESLLTRIVLPADQLAG
jgi:beta-glucosidase/6-phospho-beta-glucosidase/beta-galactosidase